MLECAWVRKNGIGRMDVYATSTAGQGLILDYDSPSGSRFHVRECSGCPDAVVLHPGDSNTPPTVGVVYPHQTKFGYLNNDDRLFELRFLTCSINPSSFAISSTNYPPIRPGTTSTGLVYDGAADAAGIVLPDLAPASVPWRFGLAFEEQLVSGSVTNGRILLETWDVDPVNTSLAVRESHAFGSSSSTTFRRRPILSSYPDAYPDRDVFAIAFNRKTPTGNGDVVYQEWDFTDGTSPLVWEASWGWDNSDSSLDDRKPAPLLGREFSNGQVFGRCYAERSGGGNSCILLDYARLDPAHDDDLIPLVTADHLQRPAASYYFDPTNSADNVALTWEQETSWSAGGNSYTAIQVWLRME